ncbi:MAG: DNA polymerase [Desulfurococcales archaeon ex4484_42]|nr:MAG: DNA polymerase [Desulfurococcales archaeon ex4484_42]
MNIKAYLLDVSYEVVGREPHILLWCIDEGGRRILLRDKTFRPYFYVLPEDESVARQVALSIRRLSKPRSPIIKVEIVGKKYYGRPVKAIRVTTVIPETVREYREEVKKIRGVREVLEADIRFAMRYLIDKGITPCSWFEVEVEEVNKSPAYRVNAEYVVKGNPKPIPKHIPPKLKVMAFDIEVYNPRGSPRSKVDPVIIIAVRTDDGVVKQFLSDGKSDAKPIREFINFVLEYDPDIIVGYNSNGFDWPYLLERAKVNGIVLDVGRVKGVEPRTSTYGHISVPGRLNVDLYDFAEEIGEVKIKSLEIVAEYLGVMKREERVLIPWYELYKYWDDPKKRPLLLKYSLDDVNSTYGIAEKILPFAIQLSNLTGLPLDQVGAASVGFRLEWYLMRAAYSFDELIPNRVERGYETYRGAIVLAPLKGVHQNIAVLDFSAMYPNIMIKYNIGPDTFVESEEECEIYGGCYIAPEVRYMFRKEPPGFYKLVLETLLKLRKAIREEMKKLDPSSPEYRVLNERQKALKILANASYGYMGWPGARWYFKPGAEAVTAWGRQTITKAIEIAKSLGLKVIYGDTDSLFVRYDKELIDKFIRLIHEKLGLEIKIDKVYKRVFFTEAKKRYIGLTEDGGIDIVGFEAVRGDWAELAKEVQEKVAYIILMEGKVSKAVDYVRDVIKKLQSGAIPVEKLIIWKTLTKPISEYEVDAPHVMAAKRLIEKGWKVEVGDKIGYVIIKGSGKISARAYPYNLVKSEDIDANYYIDHQVIPASLRILEYFGVTEKQLKVVGRGIRSLFDFAKK